MGTTVGSTMIQTLLVVIAGPATSAVGRLDGQQTSTFTLFRPGQVPISIDSRNMRVPRQLVLVDKPWSKIALMAPRGESDTASRWKGPRFRGQGLDSLLTVVHDFCPGLTSCASERAPPPLNLCKECN